jgi:hypothetical protein
VSEADEATEALSIGTMIGGSTPVNKGWAEPLRTLAERVAAARAGVGVLLGVNVVFHVPGRLLQPEFDGVRTGTYSRKRSLLMVQATLPEQPPDDPYAHLLAVTLRAIDEIEPWSKRRRVDVDLDALREIVRRASTEAS